MRFFNAIVKIFLAIILCGNISFADDFLRRATDENSYISGEYQLFSKRGSPANVESNFTVTPNNPVRAGNIEINQRNFSGRVTHTGEFGGHPWQEHGPWSQSKSVNFSNQEGGILQGGASHNKLSVSGSETHHADAYDGSRRATANPDKFESRTPVPARDHYSYGISGSVVTVKVVSIEKLNQVLPPERKITEREREKLQNGEKLSDERYRELYATVENNNDKLQVVLEDYPLPESAIPFAEKLMESVKSLKLAAEDFATEVGERAQTIAEFITPMTSEGDELYIVDNVKFIDKVKDKAKTAAVTVVSFTPIGTIKDIKEAEGLADKTWAATGLIPAGKAIQKAGQGVKAIGRMFGIGSKEKKAEKTAEKTAKKDKKKAEKTAKNSKNSEIHNPVVDNPRTGSGLKTNPHHNFNSIIDNYASDAEQFVLTNQKDGITRTLYQIEGSLNGKEGVFEWIVDPNSGVTHRNFIENGKVTGKPNNYPKNKKGTR